MRNVYRPPLRFRSLLRTCTVSLILGVITGTMATSWTSPNQSVSAQGGAANCPFNSCDFTCSTQTHQWTMDGINGIWVIVDAKPRYGALEARWFDNADPNWAPISVLGRWSRTGSADITSSATVGNSGLCSYGDPEGTFIHCHDFRVQVPHDPSDLCDTYSGNWDRIGTSSAGCLKHIEYGFDFRKEIIGESDGMLYCFNKASFTSSEPTGSGALKGRSKNSSGTCGETLDWGSGETVDTTQCVTQEVSRPGGANAVRMTVNYNYVAHPPRP